MYFFLFREDHIQSNGADASLVTGPSHRAENDEALSLAKGSLIQPVGSGKLAKGI